MSINSRIMIFKISTAVTMNKHFKDMLVHVDDKFNEDRIDDLRIFDILYAKLNKSKMATWGK